jgi:phosphoglycerate dehydrogenase-like enzyme
MPAEPTSVPTAGGSTTRVIHYARTALANDALHGVMTRTDVEFVRVQGFDDMLAEVGRADLLLLSDPGLEMAAKLRQRLEDTAQRQVTVHLLSAGREGFAGWQPPPHVVLSSAGGALAPTVAEHVLALMLGLRRGLHRFAAGAPRWVDDREATGFLGTLEASNLLIVGCGRIGREVARRALPFGMRIVGLNRSHVDHPAFHETGTLDELDDHLVWADVVVLCLPLAADTAGLISGDRLAHFRPGALLINVGRGGLIDETALADALVGGQIAGAGLDVFETEPLAAASRLWSAPNTILTPHIAGLGGEGETRIAASAEMALERILSRATAS